MRILFCVALVVIQTCFAADLDYSKCLIIKSAEVINYESKNCKMPLCLMKVECDFGQGPVVISSACSVKAGSGNCPNAQECIRDNSVSIRELDEGSGVYSNRDSSGSGRSQVLGL